MDLDLVVSGAQVVDGSGAPSFRADVGVRGGRIAIVARRGGLVGTRVLAGDDLVVAPGFIDLDSHADWSIARVDGAATLARWLRQGVTTVVGGACGFSPAPVLAGREEVVAGLGRFLCGEPFVPRAQTFAAFLDGVAARGVPLNVGFLVGQNTLRAQLAGTPGPAAPEAVRRMVGEAREALRAGALGLSVNAAFVPGALASPAELAALAWAVAEHGALLAVHARAYTRVSPAYRGSRERGPHNVRAVRELVALALDTEVRLHILHLMTVGRRTWRTCDALLRCIDAAAAEGVDVSFDAAPYTVAVGPLQALFPASFVSGFPASAGRPGGTRLLRLLAKLQRVLLGMSAGDVRLRSAEADPSLAPFEGCSFAEIGRSLGTSPTEAEVEIARRAGMNGASVMIGTVSGDDEDDAALRAILSHPRCAIGTNAASTRAGPQNPSATGAFPRVLGRYVRDLRLLTLEEAVRRMTSLPASRLGLPDIGRIAEGCWADLTLFDPAQVGDAADPERADAVPHGIRAVLVSGVPVVVDGVVADGVLPGRVLRRGADAT